MVNAQNIRDVEDTEKSNVLQAFKAESIPTEKDFLKLIDFCNAGSKILPTAADDKQPASGLVIENNRLAVNIDENQGLKFNEGKLALKIKASKSGLSAADGLGVVLEEARSGLKLTENGLALDAGSGFEALSKANAALQLKCSEKSGLACDANGLRIALDKTASGLEITPDGDGYPRIKCGTGFKIENGCLTLDLAAFDAL